MNVFYKEAEYGLTLYENSRCISCGRCRVGCPWEVPQFYDTNFAGYAYDDPNRPRMTKCNGCLDRLREGLKPACVAACWHRALDFGPMDALMEKYNHNFISELPIFKTSGTGPMIIFRPKKNKIGV
jgi:anaerobic dimethyl sulfoxide reductase subunit B (iron-sulfur subunit)